MLRPFLLFPLLVAAMLAGPVAVGQTTGISPDHDARATQLFVRGMTAAYVQDFEAAIALYEQVLAIRPGDGAVTLALAEAHDARGDLATALYHAERALEALPTEASAHRYLAELHLRGGNLAAAITSLETLATLQPRDPETLALLARVRQQAGQPREALAAYRQLTDLVGDSPPVLGRMLQLYMRTGDFEGALEVADALLDTDPENPSFRRQRAEILLELNRQDEAIGTLEEAVEGGWHDADLLAMLASIYRDRGDDASARAVLEEVESEQMATPEGRLAQAASLYMQSAQRAEAAVTARRILEELAAEGDITAEGLMLLGDLRYQAGDFSAAAEALGMAIEVEPGHVQAWEQLTAALFQAGDVQGARETVDEALLLFPGQYPLLRLGVLINAEAGANHQAMSLAREALEVLAETPGDLRSEQSLLLGIVGLVHMRQGDHALADQAHEEAHRLDPSNASVLNNWAYDLATRGERLDDALSMAREAVEADPHNPSFLDTLGWIYHVRGDHDEAARWIRAAVEVGRAMTGRVQPVILEHLGDVEAARGNTATALEHWLEALEKDSDNTELRLKIEQAR